MSTTVFLPSLRAGPATSLTTMTMPFFFDTELSCRSPYQAMFPFRDLVVAATSQSPLPVTCAVLDDSKLTCAPISTPQICPIHLIAVHPILNLVHEIFLSRL